ncbi:hypothetical protein Gotri_006810 [Gossypium trilobum]|uniref:Uncharacterized protein n=1 Tax=Gossypium trilobum TaxID=34281 RepID=A0A7J9FJR5_9ROSI|nr:hypothetical protein [Gossypium trilobum]
MENGFLDKMEDNAAVQTRSEVTQREKSGKTLVSCPRPVLESCYSCFTFGGGDLVPAVEEYMTLLRCSKIQADRVYSRANLKDLILAHPDAKKKVDVFALSVYDLVVFPKALGHVDEAVTDLFDQLDKRVTPVPNLREEDIK